MEHMLSFLHMKEGEVSEVSGVVTGESPPKEETEGNLIS